MRGVGIDLVEMNRVRNVNDRFLMKVLSEDELNRYLSLPEDVAYIFLAGRIAAKEAVIKCLSGFDSPSMGDLNIFNDENGCPGIQYKSYTIYLSISHDGDYATAIAILD